MVKSCCVIQAYLTLLIVRTVIALNLHGKQAVDDRKMDGDNGQNGTSMKRVQRSLQINCRIPQFIDRIWQATPRYPISSAEPHSVKVGDDIIIFGGFYNSFTATYNQTYARNIINVNSTWRRMEDLPLPEGITHTPIVVIQRKVYLCGGYLGGSPGPHVSNCYVYDHSKLPGSGQWSKIQNLPNQGTGGAGIIYDPAGNRLFYVGGAQRPYPGHYVARDTNQVWKYSLNDTSLGWTPSTPIPYTGSHISYVVARDGMNRRRYFFLGGQIGENEWTGNLAHVYEFVPSTERWIQRASMPFGRSHATASTVPIGCGFIIAGGAINTGGTSQSGRKLHTSNVTYYDIPTNTWTTIGDLHYSMVTPVVDIDRNGYMHFIDTRNRAFRRRISA